MESIQTKGADDSIIWTTTKNYEMELQLEDWAQPDTWASRNNPLLSEEDKAQVNYRILHFERIFSNSFKVELKYAIQKKVQNKEWQAKTVFNGNVAHVIEFFSNARANMQSITERKIEEWSLLFRTYLVEKGTYKRRSQNLVLKNQTIAEYQSEDTRLGYLRSICKLVFEFYDSRDEFEKEVWDLAKLGKYQNSRGGTRFMDFASFNQLWLKEAVKKFIRYRVITQEAPTIASRYHGLRRFSLFLDSKYSRIEPCCVNREIIVDYLLNLSDLGYETRAQSITALKLFLEECVANSWADVPRCPLINRDDYPPKPKRIPRYIPQRVVDQLNENLQELPLEFRRIIIFLQTTGRRISEVLGLPLNCLMQDAVGDWFLRYYQFKMKKEHTIPITSELVVLIQEQQNEVRVKYGNDCPYLFPSPIKKKGRYVIRAQSSVAQVINKLAVEQDIRDENGQIWRFESHQFRHTIGTNMVNKGVPLIAVMKYFGHESPEMTLRYAHLHDQTLKEEFAKFQGRVVDVTGKVVESENVGLDTADLQWFKRNVQAQALPNGSCALPAPTMQCPHANACLTCTHFRTTLEFLDTHKEQLQQTEKIIEKAEANGWQRQVEMNERIKTNLKNIISSLEVNNDA